MMRRKLKCGCIIRKFRKAPVEAWYRARTCEEHAHIAQAGDHASERRPGDTRVPAAGIASPTSRLGSGPLDRNEGWVFNVDGRPSLDPPGPQRMGW